MDRDLGPIIHITIIAWTLFALTLLVWDLFNGGGLRNGRYTLRWLLGLTLVIAISIRLAMFWIWSTGPRME
jgi:hypothetical protein